MGFLILLGWIYPFFNGRESLVLEIGKKVKSINYNRNFRHHNLLNCLFWW